MVRIAFETTFMADLSINLCLPVMSTELLSFELCPASVSSYVCPAMYVQLCMSSYVCPAMYVHLCLYGLELFLADTEVCRYDDGVGLETVTFARDYLGLKVEGQTQAVQFLSS
jgi:hypothetical protein